MSNKSGFYNNFVVDLVSGFCGGILNCITGHPLE